MISPDDGDAQFMARSAKEIAGLEAELEAMTKHANEGWALANTRTLELRDANLQNGELRGLAHALELFVGVYDGITLDKKMAQELIRKYAKRSEAVCQSINEIQAGLKPKRKSQYGWSSDPQTDIELQEKYGDSVHRPKIEKPLCDKTREDNTPCRMPLPCPRHTVGVLNTGTEIVGDRP